MQGDPYRVQSSGYTSTMQSLSSGTPQLELLRLHLIEALDAFDIGIAEIYMVLLGNHEEYLQDPDTIKVTDLCRCT